MAKVGTTLWIMFTIILIIFPVGMLTFVLLKRGKKIISLIKQKIHNIKTLDKMRNELLQQRAKEAKEENNINDEIIISSIFEIKKEEVSEDTNTNINSNTESDQTNKNIEEKQKKLLDKIFYEANFYKKDGKLEEYEKKLIEGLAIDPENLELNKQLAELYFTVGNHKKALSLLKRVIEEDPDDHNAIWQIGEIYLISGDYETAELLIEKAINIKPNNPKYYISMVEILYNTERKKDAIAVMEKVVKLRPTNSNYVLTLADLYEEIQDRDNAKKYYFRVLEQEPNNEKAKKKIQELTSSYTEQ